MDNKSRNQILLVLFLGVLMGALDIAIVGPAMPAIRGEFAVSERLLAWMFSMYVLFQLIGTPLMSKLSDLFGRRSIYILDIALFGIGSLIVGLSHNFTTVLIGRAIQGFGAGGIFPVASAVIGDTFPPEKRGSALGLIGAVFGLSFLIGPLLGALILNVATWHWLFYINVPIGLIIIVLAAGKLPATRLATTTAFDWPGMFLLAGTLASLAYALNQIDTKTFVDSLVSLQVWPFLLAALVLGAALIGVERRAAHPLLPGALFDRKQLNLGYVLSAGAGFAESSLAFVPLLAVISLQGAGITERNASYLLLPAVLAMMVGSPTSGRLLDKLGSRTVILVGTILTAMGILLLSRLSSSLFFFIFSGALIGLGLSALLGAPIRYITLNEARPSERSVAQGMVALFGNMGMLLGGVLVGAVAESTGVQNPATGYGNAFLMVAFTSALLVLLSFLLKDRSSEQVTVLANEAARQATAVEEPA
jgi:EmrB/QacA subfamily drug resistance transporter